MNENTTTQHTCHGAVFLGATRAIAQAECPACPTVTIAASVRSYVICDECGERHEATYSHEGRFNEGPVYAVVCPVDSLTDYYTTEALVDGPPALTAAELGIDLGSDR